jgi:hypothetical protein
MEANMAEVYQPNRTRQGCATCGMRRREAVLAAAHTPFSPQWDMSS